LGGVVKKYTMLFVLLGLCAFFAVISNSFLTAENFLNLATQNTYILVAAVGLSFIMMGGAMDLSVGYQISATGVLTAILMVKLQANPVLAMASGMGLCILLGALNGVLSVKLKVHPIMITIATMIVFQGVSYLLSSGNSFYPFPDSFRLITRGNVLGIRVDFIIAIVSVAIASFVYNKTYYGRYVKAMGGNVEASRLAGINVDFMRVTTFMISGFFVAIATFILISRQGTMNSTIGPGTEFVCMTGAMLGGIGMGTSGNGKVWGLVTGIFIIAIIANGMQLAGWNQYIQYVIKGAVLILAIGFDQAQKTRKAKPTKAVA
jgi:ribose/xylose/arabinose/galactoside ABC-type transport system permease subunit